MTNRIYISIAVDLLEIIKEEKIKEKIYVYFSSGGAMIYSEIKIPEKNRKTIYVYENVCRIKIIDNITKNDIIKQIETNNINMFK